MVAGLAGCPGRARKSFPQFQVVDVVHALRRKAASFVGRPDAFHRRCLVANSRAIATKSDRHAEVSRASIQQPDDSPRAMRVLMVTSEWPKPGVNITSHFIKRQADFVSAAGVDVDVLPFKGAKNPLNYRESLVAPSSKVKGQGIRSDSCAIWTERFAGTAEAFAARSDFPRQRRARNSQRSYRPSPARERDTSPVKSNGG